MLTRMGDGTMVDMTTDEIRRDLEAGIAIGSKKAKVPDLSLGDKDMLMDIICNSQKFVSVPRGEEGLLTYDSQIVKMKRIGIQLSEEQEIRTFEGMCGADTLEMCSSYYSFKYIKPYISEEGGNVSAAALTTTAPLLYGAMTNLSLYTQPDGPCPNYSELMPLGKIQEAQDAQLQCKDLMRDDIVKVGTAMYDCGTDGINFDTAASGGDCDFLGSLEAIEELKAARPDMQIEIGMSSEFVLGFHGGVTYKGKRLAGMYCHDQALAVADAGGDVFGAVVNTNTNKSFAWNLGRSVVISKYCGEVSPIPVVANCGMGVGGVTMNITPPVDVVSRASTAMLTVAKMDGL